MLPWQPSRYTYFYLIGKPTTTNLRERDTHTHTYKEKERVIMYLCERGCKNYIVCCHGNIRDRLAFFKPTQGKKIVSTRLHYDSM